MRMQIVFERDEVCEPITWWITEGLRKQQAMIADHMLNPEVFPW